MGRQICNTPGIGLMSHKTATIAWISEISLGFESGNLKLNHGMKNNHFHPLSIRLLTLKL